MRITLLLFVLVTSIYASDTRESPQMGIADLQISLGMDVAQSKPIDVVTSVTSDRLLYASAWMRYAPENTKVTFRWYRYIHDNQKNIILDSKVTMSGSRFLYATLEFDKGSIVPEGKYGVAIMANNRVLASTTFDIRSPSSKKAQKNCLAFDDRGIQNMVQQLKQHYPDMQNMSNIKLGLYSDPQNGIIFYVPNNWFAIGDGKGSILHLREQENKEANKYRVRKIEKFWSTEDIQKPKAFLYQVVKTIGDISIEAAVNDGDKAKYGGDIALFSFNSYIIAHLVVHRTGKINKWKSTTLLYDGKDIYTLSVTTKESDLQLGEFYSSLWYKTFCNNATPTGRNATPPSSNCLVASTKEDDALLEGLFDSNPQMKSVALSNKVKFKRYYDAKEAFSIIAPADWESLATTKRSILHLRYLDPNGIYLEMKIHKIALSERLLSNNTSQQILEKFAKHMSTPLKGQEVTVVKKLKVIELADKVVGSLRIKEIIKGVESYQSLSLVLKENNLYMIATFVDKPNFDLGRLLSAVGMYTFVTKDMCQQRDIRMIR